jgi:hypothetical protein
MSMNRKADLLKEIEELKEKIDRYVLYGEYTDKEEKDFMYSLDQINPTYQRGWGGPQWKFSRIFKAVEPDDFKREMDEYYEEESISLEKKIADLESELNNYDKE